MRVYKRAGSPYYFVDLCGPDGKRVRKSTKEKSRAAAIKVASELANQVKEERAKPGDPIRLKAALDRYIANLEGQKLAWAVPAATLRDKLIGARAMRVGNSSAEPTVRWHLSPDTWLHEISKAQIAELIEARQNEGLAAATICRELSVLRAAVGLCADLDLKVPDMTRWKAPRAAKKTRYLSPEEYHRLYEYLDDDAPRVVKGQEIVYRADSQIVERRREARDLLVALVFTGARWGELAALTWERVDWQRDQVRLFGTKTDAERVVAMAGELRSMLAKRFDRRDPAQPLIFPSPVTGQFRDRMSGALRDAMDAVGLNRSDIVARYGTATCHSLRHTYASWLLDNGADLKEVQDALGHADIGTTVRYAHLAKGRTVDRLRTVLDTAAGRVTAKGRPCQENAEAAGA